MYLLSRNHGFDNEPIHPNLAFLADERKDYFNKFTEPIYLLQDSYIRRLNFPRVLAESKKFYFFPENTYELHKFDAADKIK